MNIQQILNIAGVCCLLNVFWDVCLGLKCLGSVKILNNCGMPPEVLQHVPLMCFKSLYFLT